ncbi:LysR family transcriptional regulator [Actinomadura sp. NPDC048394]|uniref:LysR family transcriptional regulator n=1 Tax=Actinomadura sp. NPDC048394 TaxID=3158223 RepID=UPI0034106A79
MGLIGDGGPDRVRLEQAEVEVFLALAGELHFGRTAERLRISQPRVSQLLRSLERRIGGRLFERSSRRVALTPLGERLLESAAPAYEALVLALTDARNVARGLRIGFLGPFFSTLDDAIAVFRERHPDCQVRTLQSSWTDPFARLRSGEIDVLVCPWPVEQEDLHAGPVVAEYPRLLAVAASDPLADRPSIDLEDLADLKVIAPPPSVPAEWLRTFWPPESTPGGRPIPRAGQARTEPEMLSLVAQGAGVFVTSTAVARHFSHPGVAFVPFTGMPPSRAVLVWHAGNPSRRIAEFAAIAAGTG